MVRRQAGGGARGEHFDKLREKAGRYRGYKSLDPWRWQGVNM